MFFSAYICGVGKNLGPLVSPDLGDEDALAILVGTMNKVSTLVVIASGTDAFRPFAQRVVGVFH